MKKFEEADWKLAFLTILEITPVNINDYWQFDNPAVETVKRNENSLSFYLR